MKEDPIERQATHGQRVVKELEGDVAGVLGRLVNTFHLYLLPFEEATIEQAHSWSVENMD